MINIIVATSINGVIGCNNKLIWDLPTDLKRFKEITSGNTIIMGRKTFESLPGVLPNRKHIILTRDKNFSVDNENVEVIHNADQIINNYKNSPVEAFIIGGGEIYKEFLPHANKLYLTEVLKDFEGDTSFPQVNLENWADNIYNEGLKDLFNPSEDEKHDSFNEEDVDDFVHFI